MRNTIIMLLFGGVFVSNAHAEKGDVLAGDIQQVVVLQGMSKENIYNGSRQWVATAFNSAQSVIQMDDKPNGVIIGKGNIKYPCKDSWLCSAFANDIVKFTVKIESKDDKARITFSDITRYSPVSQYNFTAFEVPITNTTKKLDTVGQVKDEFNKIINEYKNSVSKTTSDDKW